MRKYKFITVFVLSLALVFSLGGCSLFYTSSFFPISTDDSIIDVIGVDDEADAIGQVNISIIYPEEAEMENISGTVSIYEAQATALDALNNFCWINGIDIAVETGVSSYVTSIGGVSENDYGDISGWVYTVNGEEVMEAADKYRLDDGDSVEWKFVDFGSTSF